MEETKQEPCFKNGLVTWQPFCSGSQECKLLTQPVTLPASSTMLALQSAGRLLSGKAFLPPVHCFTALRDVPWAQIHSYRGIPLFAPPLTLVETRVDEQRNPFQTHSGFCISSHSALRWGFNSFFLLRAHQFAILIALKLNSRQQGKVLEGVNLAERLHLLVCSRYSTSSLEVQPLVEKTDWLHHINLPPGLFLFHFC